MLTDINTQRLSGESSLQFMNKINYTHIYTYSITQLHIQTEYLPRVKELLFFQLCNFKADLGSFTTFK